MAFERIGINLFQNTTFPQNPTCCVELFPGLRHLAREALVAARELLGSAGARLGAPRETQPAAERA